MKLFRSAALAAVLVVASSAQAAPRIHTIVIDKMEFGPPPVSARAGDVIVWVNRDMFRHTATASDKSFDVDLPPRKEARTVLKKAGVLSYYCRFHPGMTGKVVVKP